LKIVNSKLHSVVAAGQRRVMRRKEGRL